MLTREKFINSPIEIEFELLHLLDKNAALTIFDIGACEAEDSIRYSNLFPHAKVYAFEPRPDNCAKAVELIKNYKKQSIFLEQLALSNQNGKATFYLSEGQPETIKDTKNWDYGNKSSSLLPPSEEMKKHTEWLQFKNKIEVETMKLSDYVFKNKISSIDFAHMDVQGAELMVLEGAGNFLSKIKIVWLEVEVVELYKDQPLKNVIEQFMEKNEFTNVLNKVDAISGDQLYVNRNYFSEEKLNELHVKRKENHKISFLSKLKLFFKL